MKKQKTIVNFILDKSGSMSSVKESTISGFNEYITTLKKDTKSDYEFTFTLFDTEVKIPVKSVEILKVKDLNNETYSPDGFTALYDAVCKTIKGVDENKKQKVIAIIMTDGQENSSKEYTEVQMKALIEEREKKGNWTFVYLGANQDSYAVAQNYGIQHGNITNFNATAKGMTASMRSVANNTVMYASSIQTSTGAFFSEEDQNNLGNIK